MENTRVSCKLKIPKDLDENAPAFLVDFSNGNLNLKYSSNFKFSSYQDSTSGVKRMLVADNGFLKYQSRSDEIKDDRNKFNYFIGVRNKTSKKMKIFNALNFHLKPVLKDNCSSVIPENKSYRERNDDLNMNFGSKGKKRALVAQQKYSMDSASLGDALDDISLDDSITNANSSLSFSSTPSEFDYLPPKNHEAKTVDQVYNINCIISSEEEDFLDQSADELLSNFQTHLPQWSIDNTYCEYVLEHLKTKDIDYTKAKYLIYYNHLVVFSKLLAPDIKKKDPAPQIPEPIKSCLLDQFTIVTGSEYGKNSRSFPLKMKDKVLAYMLVLALFIDDFYVNISEIQKGVKYSLKRIISVAEALGCHIRRQKINNCAVQLAELKLPLFVIKKSNKKY